MTPTFDTILIVDDQPANLAILGDLLEPAGYQLLSATSAADALRVAERARPGLILLDVVMPDMSGLSACRRLKENPATADIPVIFVTGASESSARVDGFAVGGVDYIVKPIEPAEVLARVRTHLSLASIRRELEKRNRELAERLEELNAETTRRIAAEAARREAAERLSVLTAEEAKRWSLSGLVGRSRALTGLLREIAILQPFGRTGVLLLGESGSGKELVARALHSGSPRAEQPFIPVNCTAVPAELTESMFFGHTRGSFTGAMADRKGFFELANGGTLFLDEIGDMPTALQGKLLRVLEDGRFAPVGASVEKQVDVRIIAATNCDLEKKISAGTFRQDLYFRLARTTLNIPPLRERREDIPLLATYFLRRFADEMKVASPQFSEASLEALSAYAFPGNVRELRNLVEGALIACGGEEIAPRHLRILGPCAAVPESAVDPLAPALPENLLEAESELIRRAVAQAGGNIAAAARQLGVHRSRVYRAMAQDPVR